MPVQQRGLDQDQEQTTGALLRDTRTLGQRFADFLKNQSSVAVVLLMCGGLGFFVPAATEIAFIVGATLFIIAKTKHYTLPFRMPKREHCKDYNTPKPGTDEPSISNGIYFFGNDRKTNDELWFTDDDMRTHALIFGSTGSGKTEALVSIAYNALVQGSGFIYVDGKGDNSLFAKIFSLVRSVGREDDLLLINFMTGARDIIGPQENRISNTMNPFYTGSSSMLTQLVVSLMESGGEKGGGDMWKGRAIAFVEALMRILVSMRDAGHILLDANTIRNYFELPILETIVVDKLFTREGQEPISLENAPAVVMEPLKNYVVNLPGYNREKKGKQVSQVLEQHGYITMQLTRVFSSLADTYGHIIRTNLPEVDLRDVVLNRRILVVLLPALEKSPDELANLGKIIIASLKAMMASGLGDSVEGMYSQVIERKPTNARNPFLCILDEYGYYAVPGFAVVPAQARSLGFSVIFAGQDLPAFQKASKEEAASIGANTNIKICMKLEDPLETWDFFMKAAGESHVAVVSGFQTNAGGISNQYMDSHNAQMEKRSRIDLLDLKEQRPGEYHIFFKSRIVRGKAFFSNPRPVKELRLNQFVKVTSPDDAALRTLVAGFESFKKMAQEADKVLAQVEPQDDEVKTIIELFSRQEASTPVEKGVAVLLAYCDRDAEKNIQQEAEGDGELPADELDIFAKLNLSAALQTVLIVDDFERFSQPMLDKVAVRENIAQMESLLGRDQKGVQTISHELIEDMRTVTHYPPVITVVPEVGVLVTAAKKLIESISLAG